MCVFVFFTLTDRASTMLLSLLPLLLLSCRYIKNRSDLYPVLSLSYFSRQSKKQETYFRGQPYPVLYAVAIPIRGLLDRKISKEHLQSSNESIKIKTNRNDKKRNKNTKIMLEKIQGHSIERAWYTASRQTSYTPRESQLFCICTKGIASTTP